MKAFTTILKEAYEGMEISWAHKRQVERLKLFNPCYGERYTDYTTGTTNYAEECEYGKASKAVIIRVYEPSWTEVGMIIVEHITK